MEIIHAPKYGDLVKKLEKSNQTEFTWKIQRGKNHGERWDFTISQENYNGFRSNITHEGFWVGLISHFHVGRDMLFIQVVSIE